MSSIFVFFKVKLLKGNIYLFYYFIILFFYFYFYFFFLFFFLGGGGGMLKFQVFWGNA